MKIGFDAKRAYFNSTGLGNYSRDTIRVLASHFSENEYHLYSPKITDNERLKFLDNLSNCYSHAPIGFLNNTFSSYWRSVNMKHDLVEENIDLFHGLSHELPLGIQNTKVKSIVSIHDLIAMRFPQYFSYFDRISYIKKARYACNVADKIIAVSHQTKEDIIRFFMINEEKIEVVYQGCNVIFQKKHTEKFKNEISKRFNLPQDYLLYVGTIEERKNLLTLLKCIKELPSYHLVVIGSGKAYKNKCLQYIQRHKLENQITFLSQLDLAEMSAIYQTARLLIYPSFFEGFGIPILEALFSEIPVITTKGGCFSEAGGPSSSYINPNNIDEMKKEIIDISSNNERREKMIQNGLLHAQQFTDENISKRLMSVYNSVV